jgi:hypothetical protein
MTTTDDFDGKEVRTMQSQILFALDIARDFQTREIEQAARQRRFSSTRPSVRRSLGRRVIALGQRIAAEPSLELARSR